MHTTNNLNWEKKSSWCHSWLSPRNNNPRYDTEFLVDFIGFGLFRIFVWNVPCFSSMVLSILRIIFQNFNISFKNSFRLSSRLKLASAGHAVWKSVQKLKKVRITTTIFKKIVQNDECFVLRSTCAHRWKKLGRHESQRADFELLRLPCEY